MKHSIKKIITIMLVVSILPISVFSASPQTKHMIQNTLSKYCIPNDKTLCNTPYEGQYDPNYNFCLCEDDGMVYNKSQRKCVEVPAGTYYQKSMKTNIPKKCEPGTYQDEIGKSSCKNCDTNACKTSGIGATSCYSRCSGNYVCNGSGSCVECGLETGRWREISFSGNSGSLEAGIYKVFISGAVGGLSGETHCYGGYSTYIAGGGNAELRIQIIKLNTTTTFKVKVGKKGSNGSDNKGGCAFGGVRIAGTGGKGGSSEFTINGTSYIAEGGYGGISGRSTLLPCEWYGGCYKSKQGANAGNGKGQYCTYCGVDYQIKWNCPDSGYVRIYKCY